MSLSKNLSNLTEAINALTSERDALKAENARLEESNGNYSEVVLALERDGKQAIDEMMSYKRELRDKKRIIVKLKEENAQLNHDYTIVRTSFDAVQAENAELRKAICGQCATNVKTHTEGGEALSEKIKCYGCNRALSNFAERRFYGDETKRVFCSSYCRDTGRQF